MKLYSIDDFRIDKFCIDQYRLDNYRIDGAGGGTIIDHSTPVTVVASAFTTSASARPQRLSNGWFIVIARDTSNILYLYVSEDAGATWRQLCYGNQTMDAGFSIVSYGTMVYVLGSWTGGNSYFFKFDATTITNTAFTMTQIDTGQTAAGGCSIAVNPVNGHLTAAWSSKNATYPNSFNIRSAKSVDGGVTWTKQDGTAGVDQITVYNTSGADAKNPCAVYMGNGYPMIVHDYNSGTSANNIQRKVFNGTVWSGNLIYNGVGYIQSYPSAVVAPNATIGCAWHGYGATNTTTYHIFYKPSTDNGVTWDTLVDVAVGQNASLAVDESNNFYVQYDRGGVIYQKKSTDGGATWGAETTIGIGTNPSTSIYDKFTQPLSIWKGASSVLFAGVFNA